MKKVSAASLFLGRCIVHHQTVEFSVIRIIRIFLKFILSDSLAFVYFDVKKGNSDVDYPSNTLNTQLIYIKDINL